MESAANPGSDFRLTPRGAWCLHVWGLSETSPTPTCKSHMYHTAAASPCHAGGGPSSCSTPWDRVCMRVCYSFFLGAWGGTG